MTELDDIQTEEFPARRALEIKRTIPDDIYEAIESLERSMFGREQYPSVCWRACQKIAATEERVGVQYEQHKSGLSIQNRFIRTCANILKERILSIGNQKEFSKI